MASAWAVRATSRSSSAAAAAAVSRRLGLHDSDHDLADEPTGVALLHVEGSEELLLAALLFEASQADEETIGHRVAQMSADERTSALAELVGQRANRRHLPGRGFEALRYRFQVVSDYGAFRDLQRHRMLTVQWQPLGPHLGAEVPHELTHAGFQDEYRGALERSREAWRALVDEGQEAHAPYALCLAFRIRYILDLNAREAMHLIELRSGREGHSSYRSIALEMHRLIATAHPAVANAITHVGEAGAPRLERALSESSSEHLRKAQSDP